MIEKRSLGLVGVVALVLAAACTANPPKGGPAADAGPSAGAVAPRKITAAIRSAPASLSKQKTNPPGLVGSVPGLDALEELVHAGLTRTTSDGVLAPQLAEAVPAVDNGLWKVFADGRMETTWKIRAEARWHDGTPVTTDDLLFTIAVEQDPEVGIPRNPGYDLIERVDALDRATVAVTWRRPYIEADAMFGYSLALPMPKHLLEQPYLEDKPNLIGAAYWTQDFIGTGPYRVRDWVADSHVVVRAFDQYVLGRPKIDEIEVRFIPDPNTLMANMLAGVELTIGRALSLDQALQLRELWHEGAFTTRPNGWVPINTQFINPDPPIVTDLRFRRAMLQAIDREQLSEVLMGGQGGIAHSFVSSDRPEYRAIEDRLVRYEHDPRRAAQALEALGYARSSDGALVDTSGQRLAVSIYTTIQNDIHPKTTAAVADYWKAIGVAVEQNIIPIQRAQDREYRAQYPSFELVQTGNGLTAREVRRFHSASTPLIENRFQISGNNARYRHPELDSAIDRYLTTIPRTERIQALGDIVRHQSENLPNLPLIFFVSPTLVANRLQNIVSRGEGFTEAWNAHEWDIRPL